MPTGSKSVHFVDEKQKDSQANENHTVSVVIDAEEQDAGEKTRLLPIESAMPPQSPLQRTASCVKKKLLDHAMTLLLTIFISVFVILVFTVFLREHNEPPPDHSHHPHNPNGGNQTKEFQSWCGLEGTADAVSKHDKCLQKLQNFYQTLPSGKMAEQWSKYYSSQPHVAGTAQDHEQAKWTAKKFREFGLENVRLETFYPLLNYPVSKRVAITLPPHSRYECELREDAVEGDETSDRYRDAIPPFHGYSADGNVTGPLVYVNYGRREDFEQLKQKGVNFNGTIALMRYGANFRGLKVRAAELYGCAGALVYSDPSDDGYTRGPVYPDGPWRPESSVQRGSVHYSSLYPGDPLTPGWPALNDSKRLPQSEAKSLPKIPSLPLSYRDAKPLLEALKGYGWNSTSLEGKWAGGLIGVEYWTGTGRDGVMVNLINHVQFNVTPIWNVLGELRGAEEPDKVVMLGNHRDAWAMGAVDPGSGSSSLLEVIRALTTVMRETGWRPRRTLRFASWDGEEYGMVGSVEHVENYQLNSNSNETLIAYLNVDIAASGPLFRIDSTPSLSQMIRRLSRSISDPETGKSLYDAWLSGYKPPFDRRRTYPLVSELGSGSDFVSFVDMLGVASINAGFRGRYGVYHSNFDSFNWMSRFGDPGFRYHVTSAQLWGLMALELSESLLLPFDYAEYARELLFYVDELQKRLPSNWNITLSHMNAAIKQLESSAHKLELERQELINNPVKQMIDKFNLKTVMAERQFLDPTGIPGRRWYKHIVYAPGLWAGYGADTFPTLTEAIDAAERNETVENIQLIREADLHLSRFILGASNMIQSSSL